MQLLDSWTHKKQGACGDCNTSLPHLRSLVFVTTTYRWEKEQALIHKPDKQVRQLHDDRNGNGVSRHVAPIHFLFFLYQTQSRYFSWAGNSLPML